MLILKRIHSHTKDVYLINTRKYIKEMLVELEGIINPQPWEYAL